MTPGNQKDGGGQRQTEEEQSHDFGPTRNGTLPNTLNLAPFVVMDDWRLGPFGQVCRRHTLIGTLVTLNEGAPQGPQWVGNAISPALVGVSYAPAIE
jgi:hypothetical protein